MRKVNKRIFLGSRECLRQGWFMLRQGKDLPAHVIPASQMFFIQEGEMIGTLAQKRYPEGVLAQGKTFRETLGLTTKFLRMRKTVFEALLIKDKLICRPDVLVPEECDTHVTPNSFQDDLNMYRLPNGQRRKAWRVVEVKSGLARKKDAYIDDLSYTVMVAQRYGLAISGASLVALDPSHTASAPHGESDNVFAEVDLSEEVYDRLLSFASFLPKVENMVSNPLVMPEPTVQPACKNCEFFNTRCVGAGVEHSVFTLPRVQGRDLEAFEARGVRDIRDVTDSQELSTPMQRLVWAAVTGEAYVPPAGEPAFQRVGELLISEKLGERLQAVRAPYFCLDFETMQLGLPTFAGLRPFEMAVVQYSLHVLAMGKDPGEAEHYHYLGDPAEDCREKVAQSLVDAFRSASNTYGAPGSVLVWNARFERGRLREMGDAFPNLRDDLLEMEGSIVDLYEVCKGAMYHPAMGGSYSLKNVCAALFPDAEADLGYQDGDVQDGSTAMTILGKRARGQLPDEEWRDIAPELERYCGLDTFNLLRIRVELET
eukprot:CAMPEP_0119139430 /NCGR_PEP_ID=MMETSP1310-20130426/27494_1 /TAXON_ID=464262 /ORGANISM="Genus nov. species nov., Strain RCC2339" /LENGTH=540 /DNA_ID=CAMNT_0007130721 /DNA_START=81 /DNA_END=1700 /DNA_ORIENTATION=+